MSIFIRIYTRCRCIIAYITYYLFSIIIKRNVNFRSVNFNFFVGRKERVQFYLEAKQQKFVTEYCWFSINPEGWMTVILSSGESVR